jgi:hypothetical protein
MCTRSLWMALTAVSLGLLGLACPAQAQAQAAPTKPTENRTWFRTTVGSARGGTEEAWGTRREERYPSGWYSAGSSSFTPYTNPAWTHDQASGAWYIAGGATHDRRGFWTAAEPRRPAAGGGAGTASHRKRTYLVNYSNGNAGRALPNNLSGSRARPSYAPVSNNRASNLRAPNGWNGRWR